MDMPDSATEACLAWGRSERLSLREFEPRDRDTLVRMHLDERLRAQLIDDHPLHRLPTAALFIERLRARYRRHEGLGIWHASAPHRAYPFLGWFSLMPMAEQQGEVEIGARLLPSAWGGGLALEGGELMLDHALNDLGLTSVWGACHPENRSALLVLAAMGFESVGMLPYEGSLASHHRIDLNFWREWRNTPRNTRLRRILQTRRRAGPESKSAVWEPAHESAHDDPARCLSVPGKAG